MLNGFLVEFAKLNTKEVAVLAEASLYSENNGSTKEITVINELKASCTGDGAVLILSKPPEVYFEIEVGTEDAKRACIKPGKYFVSRVALRF
jgi:hypothetical protein